MVLLKADLDRSRSAFKLVKLMKMISSICLMMIVYSGYSQTDKPVNISNPDTARTILRVISSDFYKRADSIMNNSCLFALASAKFKIHPNLVIDSLAISLGVPTSIAKPLKEAILASAPYWKREGITKTTQVIIPLFIVPSPLCREENHKDDLLSSSASMFVYEGTYKHVRRSDYADKAKGRMRNVDLILAPLIMKGRTVY